MKRSYNTFQQDMLAATSAQLRSTNSPEDFYLFTNLLQPTFPPLTEQEVALPRQEALNYLAASAGPAPEGTMNTQPFYFDDFAPINAQGPYTITCKARLPQASPIIESDNSLEYEIQRDMGMVWRENDSSGVDSNNSSVAPSPVAPAADRPNPTITPQLPNRFASNGARRLPLAEQASDAMYQPPRRQPPMEQHPAVKSVSTLGLQLQIAASEQAHIIKEDLKLTSKV